MVTIVLRFSVKDVDSKIKSKLNFKNFQLLQSSIRIWQVHWAIPAGFLATIEYSPSSTAVALIISREHFPSSRDTRHLLVSTFFSSFSHSTSGSGTPAMTSFTTSIFLNQHQLFRRIKAHKNNRSNGICRKKSYLHCSYC